LLFLVLAESALETMPADLQSEPAVRSLSRRKKKDPSKLILDSSFFPHLVRRLPMGEKRGRPDIIHISLLCALRTPLNMEGQLKIYVHTLEDKVIDVNPNVRLPRNYNRFLGLMEQLYEHGQVPPGSTPLLTLRGMSLPALLEKINPERTILFCEEGVRVKLEDYMRNLSSLSRVVTIIGGFPHGSFSSETESLADDKISLYNKPLEAWTVVSRVIYCYEQAILKET